MIIDIFLPLSLVFIMFTLGIGLTYSDFTNVFRQPKAFTIGLFNQIILLPLIAFCIILIFGLNQEMAVGFMILASCPGGVTSNIITKLANGDTALSISFTAVISILTVVTLPLITAFSVNYFMGSDSPQISILSIGLTMYFITAVPVGIGLFVRSNYTQFSNSFEPKAVKISTILFIIIVFGALGSEWNLFMTNIFKLGPAISLLIISMLTIGYNSSKLFKLSREQSITISIESGIQNATVGITIGNLVLNSKTGISLLSLPSGLYGILMYIFCLPFVVWLIKYKTN